MVEVDSRTIPGNGGTVSFEVADHGAYNVVVLPTGGQGFLLSTREPRLASDYYRHPFAYMPAELPDPFKTVSSDD